MNIREILTVIRREGVFTLGCEFIIAIVLFAGFIIVPNAINYFW